MDSNLKYDLFSISKDLGIDIDDMVDIFNVYFIEVNDLILNLRYLNQKKDWIKFRKLLHNLKGISINLKIIDIFEATVSLDNLVKTESFETIDSYITKLEDLAAEVKSEINEFFVQHKVQA